MDIRYKRQSMEKCCILQCWGILQKFLDSDPNRQTERQTNAVRTVPEAFCSRAVCVRPWY